MPAQAAANILKFVHVAAFLHGCSQVSRKGKVKSLCGGTGSDRGLNGRIARSESVPPEPRVILHCNTSIQCHQNTHQQGETARHGEVADSKAALAAGPPATRSHLFNQKKKPSGRK